MHSQLTELPKISKSVLVDLLDGIPAEVQRQQISGSLEDPSLERLDLVVRQGPTESDGT